MLLRTRIIGVMVVMDINGIFTMNKKKMENINELGDLISLKRQELGLSARELSRRAGLNSTTINRIEKGEFTHPSPDALKTIAKAIEVPAETLYVLAGWLQPSDPTLTQHLHAKYHEDIPDDMLKSVEIAIEQAARKHGIRPKSNTDSDASQDSPRR